MGSLHNNVEQLSFDKRDSSAINWRERLGVKADRFIDLMVGRVPSCDVSSMKGQVRWRG